MKELENTMHLIEVKFYGPTNTMGSRIRLHSPRLKEKVWLSKDYGSHFIGEQAAEYLKDLGHPIIGIAETSKGYAILCGAVDGLFKTIKS